MPIYLALHSQGVTTDKLITDLWPERKPPSDGGRRALISRLRNWLGTNPDTGTPFLTTISGRLTITHRLLDAELFTRLTQRAHHRRTAGDRSGALGDYQRALDLVRGQPFGGDTGPGYDWLANPERLEDRTLPGIISDATHAATALAIELGDLDSARCAANAGRLADPYTNTPLCDLLRVAMLSGDLNQAVRWAQALLQLNDADNPDDLPEPARTTLKTAFPHGVPGP